MHWRVDANSSITIIRWYDNGVVQLASSYVANQNGNKVIRWSAKENKKIQIECPAMVQGTMFTWAKWTCVTCSLHYIGCMYDQQNFTCILYIVYYCRGVAITNGWLIYRRYCNQNKIPKKKQMDLYTFQSRIAKCFCWEIKKNKLQNEPALLQL